MPVSVRLRNERGETLAILNEPYPQPEAGRDAQRYPLLAGIDPYADTIFNALQMRRLADEIRDLLATDPHSQQSTALTRIALLCQRGQSPPHQYLWFIGD